MAWGEVHGLQQLGELSKIPFLLWQWKGHSAPTPAPLTLTLNL